MLGRLHADLQGRDQTVGCVVARASTNSLASELGQRVLHTLPTYGVRGQANMAAMGARLEALRGDVERALATARRGQLLNRGLQARSTKHESLFSLTRCAITIAANQHTFACDGKGK